VQSNPVPARGEWQGKFTSREAYKRLIFEAFANAASLMATDATIYVRTDAREYTRQITTEALQATFPGKRLVTTQQPFKKDTQTALFGDKRKKPGEIDFILT
jgi:tRNA G46 methylase TrmB